jgi:hypothetical protein
MPGDPQNHVVIAAAQETYPEWQSNGPKSPRYHVTTLAPAKKCSDH